MVKSAYQGWCAEPEDGLDYALGVREIPLSADFGLGKASRAGVGYEREGPF